MLVDLKKTLIQSTATGTCQPSNIQSADLIHPIVSKLPLKNLNYKTTTARTHSPLCGILRSSYISPSNTGDRSNERGAFLLNDARPFSALYDIICKEKEIENTMSNAPQTEQLTEKLWSLSMGLADRNGSVNGRNENQISPSATETERILDRTVHSPTTSRNNSKFTVAYKDNQASDSDDHKTRPDLSTGMGETDARYAFILSIILYALKFSL